MAKDPAVLFYTNDFLTGVQDLTMEERGQYITLLCLQHQKGRLTEKVIRLCCGNAAADVLAKFQQDDKGNFFNERMEVETERRKKHSDLQRQKAEKRWNKEFISIEEKTTVADATASDTGMPLETETVIENGNTVVVKTEGEKVSDRKSVKVPEIFTPGNWDPKEWEPVWMAYRKYKKLQHKFEWKDPDSERKAIIQLWNEVGHNFEMAKGCVEYCSSKTWKGLFTESYKTYLKTIEPSESAFKGFSIKTSDL